MVLLINGEVIQTVPPDSRTLYHRYPELKEGAVHLTAVPAKVVGPVGLLHVGQREFAVTGPEDKNISIVGGDDCTTCIMVVLRHTATGVTGLAHTDGSGMEDGMLALTQRMYEVAAMLPYQQHQQMIPPPLELCLVGGFSDPHGYSEAILLSLLHIFHKMAASVALSRVCVGDVNSTTRGGINWPIVYGVGVNLKTGDIFPATFPDKGPDLPLRHARHFAGSPEMLDIYDSQLLLLRIGPFSYDPLRSVDLWLQQQDDFILSHLSSSPDVEPPNFVLQVRAALKHIQDHPFPAVTVFRDNRPRFYRKDESGAWIPVSF